MVVALVTLRFLGPIWEAIVEHVHERIFGASIHFRTAITHICTLQHERSTLCPFFVGQQAVVKCGFNSLDIQLLADEDELLPTITHSAARSHVVLYHLIYLRTASSPLNGIDDAKPWPASSESQHTAGLRPFPSSIGTRGQPKLPFGPEEPTKQRVGSFIGKDHLVAWKIRCLVHFQVAAFSFIVVAAVVADPFHGLVITFVLVAACIFVVVLVLQDELVVQEIKESARMERTATDVNEITYVISGVISDFFPRKYILWDITHSSVSGFGVTVFLPLTSRIVMACKSCSQP